MMWSRVALTLSKVFSVASAFAPAPKPTPTPPPSLMWRLFEEANRGKLSLALQEMLNLYKGEDKKEGQDDLHDKTWSSLSDEYNMDESMVSAMDAVNRFLEEQAESDRAAHRARLQLQRELIAADMAALHAEIRRLRSVVAHQHKELMRVRSSTQVSSVVGVAVAEEVKCSNQEKP